MSSVYKSKIGLELVIPIDLVFGTVLVLSIINEPNWVALLILLPVLLFMVHMFPAISLDRIEIRCGKFNSVIISPKQKVEFINHLKSINPNIELKFKKIQLVKNDI